MIRRRFWKELRGRRIWLDFYRFGGLAFDHLLHFFEIAVATIPGLLVVQWRRLDRPILSLLLFGLFQKLVLAHLLSKFILQKLNQLFLVSSSLDLLFFLLKLFDFLVTLLLLDYEIAGRHVLWRFVQLLL